MADAKQPHLLVSAATALVFMYMCWSSPLRADQTREQAAHTRQLSLPRAHFLLLRSEPTLLLPFLSHS